MRAFFALSFLAVLCNADNYNECIWGNPPPMGVDQDYDYNVVVQLGQQMELKWSTTLTNYYIYLWHQNESASASVGSPILTPSSSNPGISTYTWTVDVQGFSVAYSPIFYFSFGPETQPSSNISLSHYFNVSETAASTTISSTPSSISTDITSGPSTATTTSLALVTSSTTTTTTVSASSTPTLTTSAASTTSSSSEALPIGLGAGMGILAILLLGALGGFLLHRRRKQQRLVQPIFRDNNGFEVMSKSYDQKDGLAELIPNHGQSELQPGQSPTELSAPHRRPRETAELPS